MSGYTNLLEDILELTNEETTRRFTIAEIEKTDEGISDWEAMYKLHGVVVKEYLTVLQTVSD